MVKLYVNKLKNIQWYEHTANHLRQTSFSFPTTTCIWVFLRTYELATGRLLIEVILYWRLPLILLTHSLPAHRENKSQGYIYIYIRLYHEIGVSMDEIFGLTLCLPPRSYFRNHRVHYLTLYPRNYVYTCLWSYYHRYGQ